MKLYLSCPITGVPNYKKNFTKAEAILRQAGYNVINPCTVVLDDSATWEDYMKAGIPLMLMCDGVAVLPGWEDSAGARLEVDIAQRLNMLTKDIHGWVNETHSWSKLH